MAYKTILVHMTDEARSPALVEAGVVLARASDAHLIGLHVFPAYRLQAPVPVPFGAEMAARIRQSIEEETQRIKAIFERGVTGQNIASEWRAITSERRDAGSIVLAHASGADIVIASQADPKWEMTEVLDVADDLALGSGGPVLVLPVGGAFPRLPDTITVAWNGKRESVRAVHDALPLLIHAKRVIIVTVGQAAVDDERQLPDTELAAALARHGVSVEVDRITAGAHTVGEAIRAYAQAQGSELLVMGCYGHSRMREFALGGVTRHMLRDMTMPVLLSH